MTRAKLEAQHGLAEELPEGWDQWVLDRLDGVSIREVSRRYQVPVMLLIRVFQGDGVAKDLFVALSEEVYVQGRMTALWGIIEDMSQSSDLALRAHAQGRFLLYLNQRGKSERKRPEELDADALDREAFDVVTRRKLGA